MNVTAPTRVAPVLVRCVHLLVAGLLALVAVRAALGGDAPALVLCGVLAAVYAVGPAARVGSSGVATALWLLALGGAWLGLLAVSADGIWLAFPLFFLQLHLLPRRAGLIAVVATTAAAVAGFARQQGASSPAVVIGPALGAAVAVAVVRGYQSLYRQSEERRRLIEQLTATRADLAAAQHTAGALAERERLAREIHDTLAQGLSSITLLLRAAERALPPGADTAARHVGQARQAAADNLAEARRFVAALAPPALDGTTLHAALERLCATTAARHPVAAAFHLTGDPVPLPAAHEAALLRVAQSALTNTVRHADARTVDVTLSYLGDAVALDVVDDGRGFDPARPTPAALAAGPPAEAATGPATDPVTDPATDSGGGPAAGFAAGGFGLAAMRARMHALGGALTVESAPGAGTAVAAQLPHPGGRP
ncbi:sensor histidine kinase [Saccharothrix algeriensis]|uniref:sensor histidine kinase n=1 Tax=Saccharothrix algeriensis TaxID=173560 RepID=UPI0035564D79